MSTQFHINTHLDGVDNAIAVVEKAVAALKVYGNSDSSLFVEGGAPNPAHAAKVMAKETANKPQLASAVQSLRLMLADMAKIRGLIGTAEAPSEFPKVYRNPATRPTPTGDFVVQAGPGVFVLDDRTVHNPEEEKAAIKYGFTVLVPHGA